MIWLNVFLFAWRENLRSFHLFGTPPVNLKLASLALATAAALGTTAGASAQSAGEWTLGVGIHTVDPKSNGGNLDGLPTTRVDSSTRPSITAEYFVADKIGVEVLGALPFRHAISIDGGVGKVGSTNVLPPTVSLQYHFTSSSKVTPFFGIGVNYTKFFHERAQGALDGAKLDLDSSWGLAAHAGVDIALNPKYALRVDARYIDIDSDVSVNGGAMGKADINPLVYGAAFVLKF